MFHFSCQVQGEEWRARPLLFSILVPFKIGQIRGIPWLSSG